MTKQQYVKKESEEAYKNGTYMRPVIDGFAYGLSKGLEIAEGFAEWKEQHAWEFDYKEQRRHTTAELLEIYLTENEKNNVDKNS